MKRKPIETLSDAELVQEFVSCAVEREKMTLDGSMRELKRVINRMFALDEIFRARGPAVQEMLLPYLDDPNEGVRYWSAKRLFAIAPARARAALESVVHGFEPIAAEARSTLWEIDNGPFKPETIWGAGPAA